MNKVMNSMTMIYNEKEKMYVPKWKFDVDTMSISLFRERDCKYRTVSIISKYSHDHMRYLYNHDQDRIQELLNNGKIYWYIRKKERIANSIVQQQLKKWQDNDKEYRLAKSAGDMKKEVGIYNNLKARAEELMYYNVIYA
ncbi:MAG: TnpV protein [Oscillospiraceae bacterium]